MPPRDPRLRPYRAALWVAYFLAIVLSIGALIVSVIGHLRGPHRPAPTGALPTRATLRVCVQELEALQREQNERAWRLGRDIGDVGVLAEFDHWSRDWEQRVADLGDRCRLDAADPDPQHFGGRAELARARDAVLALHRTYQAQVLRFGREGADAAAAAADALAEARRVAGRAVEPR